MSVLLKTHIRHEVYFCFLKKAVSLVYEAAFLINRIRVFSCLKELREYKVLCAVHWH